jgi:L-aspartate oxidase
MSLAAVAGAELADLEFVQFHPTALVSADGHDGFLITEAIRGEGALLLNESGERFVDELAPRDEVALAIAGQRAGGRSDVYLDMRALDMSQFPNVATTLGDAGLDPARDLVPVAPAAHYTMGGVATGLDGEASLPGLFAVGECACNGLHGANRLASNSLAECFVFGRRAALAALDQPPSPGDAGAPPPPGPPPVPSPETRRALWRCAGLEREPEKLEAVTRDSFPLARMIARAALARTESRGAHQRTDFPQADPGLDCMHSLVSGEDLARFDRW